jgi:hypothetical protein
MGPKGSVAKITLGASGIELSYLAGLASIKLDASGVSINGLKVEMIGVVTAKVDAPAKVDVGSTATAMTNVKGTMVMIN